MGDTVEDPLQDLEKTYCPPLDPALLTAIAFDYDLRDSTQLQQLRDTLDALRLSAWEQEDLPFDPSGTSGLSPDNNAELDGILSESSGSQSTTVRSHETDLSSLTSGFSGIGLGDKSAHGKNKGGAKSFDHVSYIISEDGSMRLSGANEDDKISYLTEMFPSVDRFTVQHTLQKSNGDIDRSMDVLLNLTFFDEQPTDEDGAKVFVPKGIDGFGDGPGDAGKKKGRKRKNKNGRKQDISSPLSSVSYLDETPTLNKWDAAEKDVDFIHARTSPILKKETVRSTYHANGASLPGAIQALASAHAPKSELAIAENPVMVTQIAELTQEFGSVPPVTFAGLLQVTRGSVSAANELAAAMLTAPVASSVSELIKITASPLSLDLEDEEVRPKRTADVPVTRDLDRARSAAGLHFTAGAEALSKASLAYRRGKSDRLMGGAAAYYSAVGRDHMERARRNAAAAADALVDTQSTSSMLDLHGVSVQDAVRIASARVSEWWESLGDAKYMRGGGDPVRGGYRIVTGLGRHSHDGTSRLGPAVGKMLAREGWRVEVGEGVLTVVGVVKRR
ncbi:Smr domain protein [Aspergillus heteromorphus CBS 117.55]|uniref:Smr domain protein n=1 Tax=Aspergillus heteromorphus CBS 117.55 TaxID=1448321 RepID=A0A317W2A3_9EURO|nr:Smr domain protein [Aspergillus heteromorphus CBS 117.55]PWY78310.1 Smr domain protein [Aspergillus heteromorphus CBS 117.55]